MTMVAGLFLPEREEERKTRKWLDGDAWQAKDADLLNAREGVMQEAQSVYNMRQQNGFRGGDEEEVEPLLRWWD